MTPEPNNRGLTIGYWLIVVAAVITGSFVWAGLEILAGVAR